MDTAAKLDTAKQKKETADQAFKSGNVVEALKSYHESLMYLQGLDKTALQSMGIQSPPPPSTEDGKDEKKEKTIVDEMIEKIYSNMAACHIKTGKWARAQDCASKALAKNEDNYKAMFRKAKALGEQGFLEKSVKLFEELKKKNPSDTAIVDQEIARFRAIDQQKEKVNSKKLKGFLNKAEAKNKSIMDDAPIPPVAPPAKE